MCNEIPANPVFPADIAIEIRQDGEAITLGNEVPALKPREGCNENPETCERRRAEIYPLCPSCRRLW